MYPKGAERSNGRDAILQKINTHTLIGDGTHRPLSVFAPVRRGRRFSEFSAQKEDLL